MRVHGAWLEMRSTSANSGGRWRLASSRRCRASERVLVGHRRQAEARAAVAEVAAVVDLVVAVEARALRPRPVVRRHGADRPPAGALERPGEREAVVLDELVVAPLAVDPDPRLQRGVRQPAEAAEGRRGEEGAARGEAGGPQLRGAPVEHGVDAGRERRALDRDPARSSRRTRAGRPCRAGRSAAGRRGWRGSGRGRSRGRAPRGPARPVRTACTSSTARAAALEEATGAPAMRSATQTTPSTAAARSAQPRWPAATRVTRSSARTGSGEQRDDEHDRDGDGEVRARAADRVAQRLDADPHVARVVDGVERPVERGEEPHVEDLHEHEHAQHRARDDGQHAARGGGQQRRRARRRRAARGGAARTRRRSRSLVWFGATSAAQTSSRARTVSATAMRAARWRRARRRRRRHSHHVHSPIDAASATSAATSRACVSARGRTLGGRDRQHDPLRRRDDPAPAARAAAARASTAAATRRRGTRSARRRSRAPTRRRSGRRRR